MNTDHFYRFAPQGAFDPASTWRSGTYLNLSAKQIEFLKMTLRYAYGFEVDVYEVPEEFVPDEDKRVLRPDPRNYNQP